MNLCITISTSKIPSSPLTPTRGHWTPGCHVWWPANLLKSCCIHLPLVMCLHYTVYTVHQSSPDSVRHPALGSGLWLRLATNTLMPFIMYNRWRGCVQERLPGSHFGVSKCSGERPDLSLDNRVTFLYFLSNLNLWKWKCCLSKETKSRQVLSGVQEQHSIYCGYVLDGPFWPILKEWSWMQHVWYSPPMATSNYTGYPLPHGWCSRRCYTVGYVQGC